VNLLGYNVYRTDESQTEAANQPLNSALISGNRIRRQEFSVWQQLSLHRSCCFTRNWRRAGRESELKRGFGFAADTFPPAAPERPSIAAPEPSSARLAIFFAANKETDIAGYNIYRSTDPDLPKQNWTKLNQTLLTRTTIRTTRLNRARLITTTSRPSIKQATSVRLRKSGQKRPRKTYCRGGPPWPPVVLIGIQEHTASSSANAI
jgi:hypothetical protein